MLVAKELTPIQIETLIDCHKNTPNWPRSVINKIFARTPKKDENGKNIGVNDPYIRPYDTFFLPANTLPNQKEGIETTAGSFFFNSYVIVGAFKDKMPYINKEMRMPELEALSEEAVEGVQIGKYTEEELISYFNKIFRLSLITEPFNPGISTAFLKPIPEVEKKKEELFEKYKDAIEAGDAATYAAKVEKPLLELAKEHLKNEDCWSIYGCGNKPEFGNNYKNNMVSVGPMANPVTKKWDIIKNAYTEGLDPSEYPSHVNKAINSSYNRAVETSYSGAKTKFLYAAMSNSVAGPKGSDCGTTLTLNTVISSKHKKDYMFRYIVVKDKLVCLTPDVIDNYLDKPVKLRTPLYCVNKNVCNKCLGDLFYILGIRNVGLTATRTTASIMQIAMKAMHDSTIKTIEINPYDFMTWIHKI